MRQRVEGRLAEPRVVGRVGEQRRPLLADRGVEQPAYLLERAAEPALLAQLAALLADLAQHLVQAARAVAGAAPQQSRSASRGGRAGQDVVAELVERPAHVVRRRERVRPVVPARRSGSRAALVSPHPGLP